MHNKKILHICNGFSYKIFYNLLFIKLANSGFSQLVFSPIRKYLKKVPFKTHIKIKIHYSELINVFDRIFFLKKKAKLYKNIISSINLNNLKLSHAHTLFSDGVLALELKKTNKIKYIVTVRNTDIYVFFKYFFIYRKIGIEILEEAEKIIFISPSYKNILFNKYIPKNIHSRLKNKASVITNGLDDYWLLNKAETHKKEKNVLNLIYVGDFTNNKNVKSIIEVVNKLNDEGHRIILNLVGGGGYNSKSTLKLIERSDKSTIRFHGRVNEKKQLLKHYRNSDIFIMPSYHETFGIVYLEAMSQGLPIIYSKNQGIDGCFDDSFPGISVDPKDLYNIKESIINIAKNIEFYSKNSLIQVDSFSWDIISKKFIKIYNKIN